MKMTPKPYQQEFRSLPRDVRLLVQAGSKGSSKTSSAFYRIMDLMTDVDGAQVLWVRPTERPLLGQFAEFKQFLTANGVAYRAKENELRVYVGDSCCYFAPAPDPDFVAASLAGSGGYELVVADEAQTWTDFNTVTSLLALNRSTKTSPQMILCCNPGGPSGYRISALFVQPAKNFDRGVVFTVPSLEVDCITLHSVVEDGALDVPTYEKTLLAACGGNRALYERLRWGNFDVLDGAAFEILQHHIVDWPSFDWDDPQWSHIKPVAAGDHGSRAIFVIGLGAMFERDGLAPDGTWYAKNSIVILDEATSASPESSYTKAAYDAQVSDVADAFYKMIERQRVPAHLVPVVHLDSAVTAFVGHTTTIFEEYKRYMRVIPARKTRIIEGVQQLNTLLAQAQPPFMEAGQSALPASFNVKANPLIQRPARQLPGLFFCPRAAYIIFALQNILRDPKNIESLDPSSKLDHAVDMLRYMAASLLSGLTGKPEGAPPIATSEVIRVEDHYGAPHVLDVSKKQKRSARHRAALADFARRNRGSDNHPDIGGGPRGEGFGPTKPDEPARRYTSATPEPLRTPLPGNLNDPRVNKEAPRYADGTPQRGSLNMKGAKPKLGDGGVKLPGSLQAPPGFKGYKISRS